MSLNDILQAIDQLSREDKRKIRDYIDQSERHPARGKTPEERFRLMEQAAKEIRADLTDEEWAEVEAAMHEKCVPLPPITPTS